MLLVVILTLFACDQIRAAVPTFTNKGLKVVTINEYQSSKKLTDVQCTDADNDDTTISIESVVPPNGPCSNCFIVIPSSLYKTYTLEFSLQSNLDYKTTPKYEIMLDCTDRNDEKAATQFKVEVRVIPNTPPYLPTTYVGILDDTKAKKRGDAVFDVQCTDANSDPLTYNFTALSHAEYFSMDASGVVSAAQDLNTLCQEDFDFEVTCKDPTNPAVGPVNKHIQLNGANQQPFITGISFNKDVPEDTAMDTTLGTFTVNDDDSVTCLLFASPTESLQYFDINFAQRAIIVKSKLNYEQPQTRNTNLTVTCTDNLCTSNAAYLYVRVTEVNEPIELFPQDFTLSAYEGNIDIDPNWTPIDEDVGDDPTYTIVGGNTFGRFAINPTTGRITSTLEYDVDGGAMATRDTIVVQVKDEGGHTSTSTVSLTILDSNDNRPTFNKVDSQTFSVQDCTAPGTSAGSILATDADSTFQGNNVLTYSGSNGPLTVSPNGAILVGSAITAGTTYSVQVTATDAGEVPRALSSLTPATVTVSVTVSVTDCTAQNSEPGDCLDSAAVTNELTFRLLCTALVLSPAILMVVQT